MSTSLLYHRFGLRGSFHYRSTSYVKNVTIFNIAHNSHFKCPECRSHKVIKKGIKTRSFLATPVGLNPSVICINHQRIYCHKFSVIAWYQFHSRGVDIFALMWRLHNLAFIFTSSMVRGIVFASGFLLLISLLEFGL